MAHLSRLCCFSALALFITLNIQALVMNSVLVGTNSVIFAVLIVPNTTNFWLLSCVLSLSDPAPLLHCLESRKYCNWEISLMQNPARVKSGSVRITRAVFTRLYLSYSLTRDNWPPWKPNITLQILDQFQLWRWGLNSSVWELSKTV